MTSPEDLKQLAPTGTLRGGVVMAPAASAFFAIRDGGGAPCHGVRKLVGERLDAVNQRIVELQALRDELHDLLTDWDVRLSATMPGKPARLLDALAGRPGIEGARRSRVHQSIGKAR